jgi:ribonucleoside-diphosphate reductase alpha chain
MSEHINKMLVEKRNGEFQKVSFDKIIYRIENLSDGLNVDATIIAQKVIGQIHDKIKTSKLDELTAEICYSMYSDNVDYNILASRVIISNSHKNTSPSFSEAMTILYNNKDENGQGKPILSDKMYNFVLKHKEKLNSVIDYSRDYDFDYFGYKTLERSYLAKTYDGKIIERIQHLIMRVSVSIHLNDLKSAICSYNYMSQKYFIHATPTLYNAGTNKDQYASCFLLGTHDSIEGIFQTLKDCALISKGAGGIGVHISNIRSCNSYINGTNGFTNGIIPMLKVFNETSKYVDQGGKRPGAFAIYLEPHHPEIISFLNLRKNHGNEEERCRNLFLALWISDLFMERVDANENWATFNDNECPGLIDAYGDNYKELYRKYESEGKSVKTYKARDIWNAILTSQKETGIPYIGYKCAVNKKSNQQNLGTIRSSNLCIEINEYSDTNEYSVCTLASVNLTKFVNANEKTFDHDKLIEVMEVVLNNLNRVIDINYYPVHQTETSNMKHRPIGIGVQGLANVFALMRIPFESEAARKLNKEIFETMYYGAMVASNKLAKKDGAYSTFKGSPLSNGKFQFDLWGVKPSNKYNWDDLRDDIMKNGVRNSLCLALMPTASTSQILGNNECFEPFTSNLYVRRTIAGDFIIINSYLVNDLNKLNLWSNEIKDKIIFYNGSIQQIEEIPNDIKALYKTAWEMKQKALIDLSIDRSPFICQSQSLNLFFEEPKDKDLTGAHFYGWKNGLKTGSYYIRTRPKIQAQQFTLDPNKFREQVEKNKQGETKYEVCENCSA